MTQDVKKQLSIISGMISMGEKISWGSDVAVMQEALSTIEQLESKVNELSKTKADLILEFVKSYTSTDISEESENLREFAKQYCGSIVANAEQVNDVMMSDIQEIVKMSGYSMVSKNSKNLALNLHNYVTCGELPQKNSELKVGDAVYFTYGSDNWASPTEVHKSVIRKISGDWIRVYKFCIHSTTGGMYYRDMVHKSWVTNNG